VCNCRTVLGDSENSEDALEILVSGLKSWMICTREVPEAHVQGFGNVPLQPLQDCGV
jgi:hypothetical protein